MEHKVAPVTNPNVDVGEILGYLVADTGVVQESMGGFPWDDVFKALLYRDFRVHLSRHKADIFIEAVP
jgi:hypothetical protein